MALVGTLAPQSLRAERAYLRRAAAVLSLGLGYHEVKNYSFYGPREASALGVESAPHVRVRNPLSEEQDRLVTTTAARLLRAVQRNIVRVAHGRLWEHGRLFGHRTQGLPEETEVLGLCTFDRELREDPGGDAFRSLVADVRTLLDRTGARGVAVRQGREEFLREGLPACSWLHAGRRAALETAAGVVAFVGEAAPSALRAFEIPGRAALAEVRLDLALAACPRDASGYRPLLRYPVVPFDVAVLVPRRTAAEDVRGRVEAVDASHIRHVEVFDAYEGAGIPEGTRSIAVRCELYDENGTLDGAQADALRARIIAHVESAGWTVRRA